MSLRERGQRALMSRLKRNVFANFGGQFAATAVQFVTLPLYVRYLGDEGYGLVSFILALQAVTIAFDFGLSTTANREVSRYIAQERTADERRDLIRTLESYYVLLGVVIFVVLATAAPWLSRNWFQTKTFDAATLRTCLLIAAASIGLRWPVALYEGVLRGTERQVMLNAVGSSTALLRSAGTVLGLIFVSRSVTAFYWWQLGFSGLELATYMAAAAAGKEGFVGWGGHFDWSVFKGLWRFSVNVGGLSCFALVLKQLDKLLISNLMPIQFVGFYNAARLGSSGITKLSQPVQGAVFPRLTSLHATDAESRLADTFHRACQLTNFLSIPAATVMMFFPYDVLFLWTRNVTLATSGSTALSILAAAMLLNSMMSVPFSLQLAAGITWLPLVTNGLGAAILAPLMYFLVRSHGLAGGATAWFVFNLLYVTIVPPIMFRYVLVGRYTRWVMRDTLPFLVSGIVCFGLAYLVAANGSLITKILANGAALAVYAGITLMAAPMLRASLGWPRHPRELAGAN
jgi:O-antigen/teichoic acid export membrane protein